MFAFAFRPHGEECCDSNSMWPYSYLKRDSTQGAVPDIYNSLTFKLKSVYIGRFSVAHKKASGAQQKKGFLKRRVSSDAAQRIVSMAFHGEFGRV